MTNYIEVCGCIGAGKTTFTSHMAVYDYLPVIENYSLNPYLELFHQYPDKVGFETELSFLTQHYHLIKKMASYTNCCMCDFSFVLDAVYSELVLPPKRNKVFNMLIDEMLAEIGLPKAIVYLKCPPNVLLYRIKSRNRPFELQITDNQVVLVTETLERKLDEVAKYIKAIKLDGNSIVLSGHECNLGIISDVIKSAL